MGTLNRSRSLLANALLGLAATAATLGALELAFRALDLRGYHAPRTRDWQHALVPEAERLPDVGVQFLPNSEFTLNYDSDPRGYFDGKNGLTYRINEHGFRGPGYPLAKPAGARRVVLLGDSFTFGEGVRFTDTFGHRLEALLNRDGGSGVEVLNLGVSGAGTTAELSYLRHRGVRFQPDLVILIYVLNDAGAGRLDVWRKFTEQYQKRWLRGSYLVSYLYARVGRHVMGRRYIDSLVDAAEFELKKWERSMQGLSEAKEISASAGSRFAVAVFPFMYELGAGHPFRQFHHMVSRYCANHGIEVVDLLPAFEGHVDTDLWVHPGDQHPNEIGHAIAAEAIADFVASRRLLDSNG